MRLDGERIYIRKLRESDAETLLDWRMRNRTFLEPYEPIMPDAHFTLEGQLLVIRNAEKNWTNDSGYSFGIFLQNSEQLIGRVSLSNVVRRAWENCTIGYSLDKRENGKGFAAEAVRLAVRFALETAGLHRVQAAVMPRNERSIRVLERTGFRYEGLAEYYLKINGVWEHHHIYSVTREHWQGQGTE